MTRFVPVVDLGALIDDLVAEDIYDVARKIAGDAARRAPRTTGNYARSLRAASDADGTRAETTDFAGHIIEWGSVNNPAYAPLRSAAADAGRFVPE